MLLRVVFHVQLGDSCRYMFDRGDRLECEMRYIVTFERKLKQIDYIPVNLGFSRVFI